MPIVVAYGDPVGQGLVASLARPGGNVTGLSAATAELSGKRLQLLKEALPGIARLAVLAGVGVAADQWVKDLGVAGRDLGVQLRILRVGNPGEFESAFAAMSAEGAEAVVVTPAPIFAVEGGSVIVDLAMKRRLPTMFETRQNVDSGGLMAYGPNLPELARRAATYVDKILKGAKPADLPVERPTTFDFVINLTTARTLGLSIPDSLLQQATELIQ
jgi:putative ABC transport system substrate-binding protein